MFTVPGSVWLKPDLYCCFTILCLHISCTRKKIWTLLGLHQIQNVTDFNSIITPFLIACTMTVQCDFQKFVNKKYKEKCFPSWNNKKNGWFRLISVNMNMGIKIKSNQKIQEEKITFITLDISITYTWQQVSRC